MCPAFRLAGEGRGLPRICEFSVEAACFGVACSDHYHLPGLTCPSARESCSPGNLGDPCPQAPPVPILGLCRSSLFKIILLIYLRVSGCVECSWRCRCFPSCGEQTLPSRCGRLLCCRAWALGRLAGFTLRSGDWAQPRSLPRGQGAASTNTRRKLLALQRPRHVTAGAPGQAVVLSPASWGLSVGIGPQMPLCAQDIFRGAIQPRTPG